MKNVPPGEEKGDLILEGSCKVCGHKLVRIVETSAEAKTLSVSIERDSDEVYAFLSNPENLPKWAMAFCKSVRRSDGTWIIDTPQGSMNVRFVEKNVFRVVDHYVSPAPGVEVYVPMRVLAKPGGGSEVIFTLFRQPDMSDAEFERDIEMVKRDLDTLKLVQEQK